MVLSSLRNELIVADTTLKQAIGLMFKKGEKMLFAFKDERIIKIHTWFMFYPIDVVIFDSLGEEVEVKKNIKPFSYWSSTKKGKYLFEIAK